MKIDYKTFEKISVCKTPMITKKQAILLNLPYPLIHGWIITLLNNDYSEDVIKQAIELSIIQQNKRKGINVKSNVIDNSPLFSFM